MSQNVSFFLGSKKRDLGDKSRNVEDSKKHRENSDSTNSLPDDVFMMISIHLNVVKYCLKNIELQVKELSVLHEDTKISQIKGKKQLDSLVDALELLSAKFD